MSRKKSRGDSRPRLSSRAQLGSNISDVGVKL